MMKRTPPQLWGIVWSKQAHSHVMHPPGPTLKPHFSRVLRGVLTSVACGVVTTALVPLDPIVILAVGSVASAATISYVRNYDWRSNSGFYGFCVWEGVSWTPPLFALWPWRFYSFTEAYLTYSVKLAFFGPVILLFCFFLPVVVGYCYFPKKALLLTVLRAGLVPLAWTWLHNTVHEIEQERVAMPSRRAFFNSGAGLVSGK